MCFEEVQQLVFGVVFLDDCVVDVGVVEGVDEVLGVGEVQLFGDFMLGWWVGGGGECDVWYVWLVFVQYGQLVVFGMEVMVLL